jgi:hypothetical protein
VHERQVVEPAFDLRNLPVEAARERMTGHRAGGRVGVVHARPSAEHVARELVEQDDERQRAFRRGFPLRELALGSGTPELDKARGDLGVEGRVLLEPLVRAGRAPKGEHVHRSDRLRSLSRAVAGHSRIRPALMSANNAGSRRTKALRRGSLK